MTLHVAPGGGMGRHFVLYQVSKLVEAPTIKVLRPLHASVDVARHVGSSAVESSERKHDRQVPEWNGIGTFKSADDDNPI